MTTTRKSPSCRWMQNSIYGVAMIIISAIVLLVTLTIFFACLAAQMMMLSSGNDAEEDADSSSSSFSFSSSSSSSSLSSMPSLIVPMPIGLMAWSIAQWMPAYPLFLEQIRHNLQGIGWKSLEQHQQQTNVAPLNIPTIDLSDPSIRQDPLTWLVRMYGTDWKDRPLLLKGLWNVSALQNPQRRLSLQGLEKESMTIPYFTDARVYGALTPDAEAPVREIMHGMIEYGRPYKIASQRLVQANPSLLSEVAPMEILNPLFGGDRFTQDRLLGHITSPWNFLRGPLTVPLFVAHGSPSLNEKKNEKNHEADSCSANCCEAIENGREMEDSSSRSFPTTNQFVETTDSMISNRNKKTTFLSISSKKAFTGLHCEPIGNVAVNLAGVREWTLVDPQYSHWLKPSVSPDGRGFFASWATSIEHVPARYVGVQTLPGDALWVPTWTWHRVDYVVLEDDDERATASANTTGPVAMGASLFHFRPLDFVRRNPLYAILLLPYLVGEFVGSKSQ